MIASSIKSLCNTKEKCRLNKFYEICKFYVFRAHVVGVEKIGMSLRIYVDWTYIYMLMEIYIDEEPQILAEKIPCKARKLRCREYNSHTRRGNSRVEPWIRYGSSVRWIMRHTYNGKKEVIFLECGDRPGFHLDKYLA